jgi:nicotinamide-nucleotide amidase
MPKTISILGPVDSEIVQSFADFSLRFPGLNFEVRTDFPLVYVTFRQSAEDRAAVSLPEGIAWIADRIGERVISPEGRPLEEETGRLLKASGATLAVAESCTGGLLADLLTNVPGSSDYFLFSGVVYSNAAKVRVLGVSPATLENCGAVHTETAKEMAEGARRVAGATFGLSTTGIAGPSGGSDEKQVGTVCIGIAAPGGVEGYRFRLETGDRLRNKKLFAMTALNILRQALQGG